MNAAAKKRIQNTLGCAEPIITALDSWQDPESLNIPSDLKDKAYKIAHDIVADCPDLRVAIQTVRNNGGGNFWHAVEFYVRHFHKVRWRDE